jgi:3-oxoacyl-[acyl-carrier protein] reductase
LGAHVTVLARSSTDLADVASALPTPRQGQNHGYIAVDMRDHARLREVLAAYVAHHPVQILINNSGGPPGGAAHEAAPQAFVDAFEQHLVSGHILVQGVLDGMRAARYGRIVNVISTSVKEPIRNLGVSNTVRGAVASWAKTLATELGPHGITVNNVLPGYTRTQRLDQIITDRVRATGKSPHEIAQTMQASVPAGRFAEPVEIANAIAFLASPAAAYINGINLPVDGGRTQSL